MGVEQLEVADVYARTCAPLIGLLTVLGGSSADAEEVAHDAFVKLLEHWPKVRRYEDVDGWVRGVAVRLMISRQRRRRVASIGLIRLAARPGAHVGHDGHDDLTRVDLDEALRALPVTWRAVLLLHHAHDLSVAEVAEILRVPVGTVKSRLSRARDALGPLLEERTTP